MPKTQQLKSEAPKTGPRGTKFLNLSMAKLNPQAADYVAYHKEPVYCGEIVCQVWDVQAEQSQRFPNNPPQNVFYGSFLFKDYQARSHQGAKAYLPKLIGDGIAARIAGGAKPVYSHFEVWCEPSTRTDGAKHFYQPYNLMEESRDPIFEALAVEAGFAPGRALPRPAMSLTPQIEGDNEPDDGPAHDPQTGELTEAAE